MSFLNCEDSCIQLVKKFYKGDLNFILHPEEIKLMTWTWQEVFLDIIFNTNLIKKYPVNYKFAGLFLKKILSFIENSQEVHDNFYTQICTLMCKDAAEDNFCYRHYVIGNNLNNVITIKETKNTVVNGTTGMKTWEAAFVLSDWALCNKEVFTSKKVLELGSGVGFTGITLAKLCKPQMFLLTDCHSVVLRTICDNIEINFPELNEVDENNITYYNGEENSLGVMILDWNNIEDIPENIIPEVIIGADIVYDPVILQPLCNVIDYFYKKNKQLEVYIASVIRNEDTFGGFLRTLEVRSFLLEELSVPKSKFIDWDPGTKVCLLKIQGK